MMKTILLKKTIILYFAWLSLTDGLLIVDRSSNVQKVFNQIKLKEMSNERGATRKNGQTSKGFIRRLIRSANCFGMEELERTSRFTVHCTKLLARPFSLQLHYDRSNLDARIKIVTDSRDYFWIHLQNQNCNMFGIKSGNQFYFVGLHNIKPGLRLIPGAAPTTLDCSRNDPRFFVVSEADNGSKFLSVASNGLYLHALVTNHMRFVNFIRNKELATPWDLI